MNARLKAAGLVLLGAALAVVVIYLWQNFLSRDAEIRMMHAACIKEFAEASKKLKSGTESSAPSKPDGVIRAWRKGASEALGKWLGGVTGSASDAICSTLRDACKSDFEGRICFAARDRYR